MAWFVGYFLCGLTPPQQWGWVWLPVDVAAIIGSTIIASRMKARGARRANAAPARPAKFFWPAILVMLSATLFLGSVYYIFAPGTPEPYLVLPALVMGLLYAAVGAWRMRRMGWIGAAIFILVMIGFVFLKPILAFWIAAVGGGGLVLGGPWLRKA